MAYLGKVVNAILKSGFTVAKSKMAVLSAADAQALYGGREDAAGLVAEVSSGPCVGLALVAEDAVDKFNDLMVGQPGLGLLHQSGPHSQHLNLYAACCFCTRRCNCCNHSQVIPLQSKVLRFLSSTGSRRCPLRSHL